MQRNSLSAVYYRPIDAAIRWAGLFRFREDILAGVRSRTLPATLDCPHCNELRLYSDRIYDAIFHGELPYGQNGITMHDESLWDSPDLTIRPFSSRAPSALPTRSSPSKPAVPCWWNAKC